MYTGHVALALGAQVARPDLPLWLLVLAAQGADWTELLLRLFVDRGESVVGSHAAPWVIVAAVLAAAAVGALRRSISAAVIVLLLYLSHPVGDYVTSFKVLWQGAPAIGLTLVERPATDFAFQASLCVLGCTGYWYSLPATRRHRVSAILPLALLLALQGSADLVLSSGNRALIRAFIASAAPEHREAPESRRSAVAARSTIP